MNSYGELERRCAASGLKIEYHDPQEEGDRFFAIITEPGSEWPWHLTFGSMLFDEETLLASEFEHYRPLSGYDATWSKERKSIECELSCEDLGLGNESLIDKLRMALGLEREVGGLKDTNIQIPTGANQPRVSICWSSPEHRVWRCVSPAVHLLFGERVPVLRIDGLAVKTDAEARRALESYGVAALLELDRGVGFHARLRGHYPWRIFFAIDSDRSSTALNPLESAPEIEPTSLYWQGRSAGNLPAQFLGFYQVLEYYFPRCSRIAFVQELRAKLDKSSQECVDKVVFEHLEAAARSKGRPFGSEEDQLVCTLRAIVSEVELREFVNGKRHLREHYEKTNQGIVGVEIPINSTGEDLLKKTAKRLYKIRCRIVHAKEGGEGDGVRVFLPLSAEAADLYCDVAVIGFLARSALKKMSTRIDAK